MNKFYVGQIYEIAPNPEGEYRTISSAGISFSNHKILFYPD
jgi:hypothetical protein